MKEYFSHDYTSRNDPKILKLRMQLGWEGVGIYWALVEIAYEQGGVIAVSDIDAIAFDMRTDSDRIANVLNGFDLFYLDGDVYRSESINRRLDVRNQKSEKAKQSANARWETRKNTKPDANALRSECDGNAIKEKESKVKESKSLSWKDDFSVYLSECNEAYNRLTKDPEYLREQEYFNPGVNVLKSIWKGYKNFWGTEIGWKHKKKCRTKTIDWKSTITNSITLPANKVYLTKEEQAK